MNGHWFCKNEGTQGARWAVFFESVLAGNHSDSPLLIGISSHLFPWFVCQKVSRLSRFKCLCLLAWTSSRIKLLPPCSSDQLSELRRSCRTHLLQMFTGLTVKSLSVFLRSQFSSSFLCPLPLISLPLCCSWVPSGPLQANSTSSGLSPPSLSSKYL